jgi:RHS repeat-associated protein
LDRVAVQDRADGGQQTVVQYSYVLDAGQEWAGLLRSATWPEYSPPRVVNYEYLDGGTNAFIASQSGYLQTYQLIDANRVTVATGATQDLRLGYGGSSGGTASCSGAGPLATTAVDLFARAGDGVPGSSLSWTSVIDGIDASWAHSGARVWRIVDSCDGGACNGMSQGSMRWEYACNPLPYPSFSALQAAKDKRDNWRFYDYQRADAGIVAAADVDAGMYLLPEERVEKLGATDINGLNPLLTTTFGYTYGSVGQTPRAYEQLRQTTERDSIATSTPNAKARTRNVYDVATNRLKATINSGWTQRFDSTTQTWVTEQKYSGTFYFTSRVCTGESTPDPLGRTLEIHGPCWVTGEDATDCPAGTATPVTQYFFWPGTETSNRANRLQKVSRYPNNGGPTNCMGVSRLDTTYNQYDPRGHPTEVIDPNGVSTVYTYEVDSIKSTTTGGLSTNFTYDNGKLTAIRYPQGNHEVFCYRTGTTGAACSGGNWTPLLQWKAKAGMADGSDYSERVTYAYWPNGTIQTETYLSSSGGVRRVRQYAVDAHKRPTFEQWGDVTGSQYTATRGFDGADNLSRIGLPYNNPPAWCLSSGLPSTACSQLTYDRANRLAIVDEYPTPSSGIRTCIDHDAQGNVAKVSPGCQTSQACAGLGGGLSSCTLAASLYQYDDFGNLIQATLPWMDNGAGGAGKVQYGYDAQGNLLTKQTPAMGPNREWLAYTYDMLGRVLSATHYWTLPAPGGSESLYQFAYDSSQTISTTCTAPALPANTAGRLLLRTDSFGQTWYKYDIWGRVTMEIRLRNSTCGGSIDNNPHTSYTYTANGNLSSVTYPHGRTVTYVYYPGAQSDRISRVDVSLYNGTSWNPPVQAIAQVAWEPYGGLRAYQTNHPNSANSSAVEYFLGDNAQSPGCPSGPPSSNDHTGRLRALRVSTGALTLGTSSGDIYKRTYTWRADQVSQIDTCLLGAINPRTEQYTYDQLLRLTSGPLANRTYSYDLRGNRAAQADEVCSWNLSYSPAHPDQLTRRATSCPNTIQGHNFAYDVDGRVTTKNWPVDSSGLPAYSLTLTPGPSDSGATDSVYKMANVNGATYSYYYDAFGRRRFKSYPLVGADNEYFHNGSNQLLSDRGVDSMTIVGNYPEDDYIWLDGRPVAVVRGKFNATTWSRLSDSTADCMRNDEAASCGLYFVISDHIGKPVLMLDSSRRIAGVAEHDAFGQVNRVPVDSETAHPYLHPSSGIIANFTQSPGNLSLRMRVVFHLVDVQDSTTDYAELRDGPLGPVLAPQVRGYHAGEIWSPWVQPSAGNIAVFFTSGGTSCCPDGLGGINCTCPQMPWPYTGIVVESYEYQRYEPLASRFWTPLRFPGQYYDDETELFENWNRYYDPATGRYLQPEPLLSQFGRYTADIAQDGLSTVAYAYAHNNPIGFSDPTGLQGVGHTGFCSGSNCAACRRDPNSAACTGEDPDMAPRKTCETVQSEPPPEIKKIPNPSKCSGMLEVCLGFCKSRHGWVYRAACATGCYALYAMCSANPGGV